MVWLTERCFLFLGMKRIDGKPGLGKLSRRHPRLQDEKHKNYGRSMHFLRYQFLCVI